MRHLKEKQGMTLVSIIVAFIMLVLVLAVFSAGLTVSSRMQQSAIDGQNGFSDLYEQYYTGKGNAKSECSVFTMNFHNQNGESISLIVTQEALTDGAGNELRYFK